MKYKLKEHVTDEMLVAVGFEIEEFSLEKTAWRYDENEDGENHLYIILDDNSNDPKNTIDTYCTVEDMKDYIQDLIDLGYVEEVKG